MEFSKKQLLDLLPSYATVNALSDQQAYEMSIAYKIELDRWMRIYEKYQTLRLIEIFNEDNIEPVTYTRSDRPITIKKIDSVMLPPVCIMENYPCHRITRHIYKLAGQNVWKIIIYHVFEVRIRYFTSISQAETYIHNL